MIRRLIKGGNFIKNFVVVLYCFFMILVMVCAMAATVYGGTLEYICFENDGTGLSGQGGPANRAPSWGVEGTGPPNPFTISLATSTTVDCDLSHYNDANYQVGNDCLVRHYARITRGAWPYTCEVRFYYTVGTSTSTVSVKTNIDAPGNENLFIKGQWYKNDALYNYYYAEFPTDIHAAGDPWDPDKPTGIVGVRVSGRESGGVWQNENTGQTYTYYVRKSTASYKAAYPGEAKDNVRSYPLKHVEELSAISNRLTNLPESSLRYFMPNGEQPVNFGFLGAYTRTVPPLSGSPDDDPDVFYGEKPDLYLRLAYGDVDSTSIGYSTSTKVVFELNSNGVWIPDNSMDIVSTNTISGIDNAAVDDTVAWGLGSALNPFPVGSSPTFYGRFSFMKTPTVTKLANDSSSNAPPETTSVKYYFRVQDGSQTKFRSRSDTVMSEATARLNAYRYYVLQDDFSRPYIQYTAGVDDVNGLRPQNVTDPGNCSWTNSYTIKADLCDLSDGAYAPPLPPYDWDTYCNVVIGRGSNSGIYHNPNANAIGSLNNPVHDTRLYYRISTNAPASLAGYQASDKYLINPNVHYIPYNAPEGTTVPVYELNDNGGVPGSVAGDGCGYVQMAGPAGGGQWTASIPLRKEYINKYLYYRIYVCNDDNDPQSVNFPSLNIIMGGGLQYIGRVDNTVTPVYNNHYAPTAWGAAFGNPYDLTAGGACDTDRDHGWAMFTRYGGQIVAQKMIKMRARVTIGGVTKEAAAYINAEGNRLGNVIYMNTERGD